MSENCEIDLSEHSEESGEDFSASEDDWVPDKKLRHETSSSDDSDDFEETSAGKAIARKKHNTQRRFPAAHLHARQSAVPVKKKANTGESGDSSDDYLVDSRTLDLKSKFFDVAGPSTASTSSVPNFDCNVGLNLTDSDDEDDDEFEAVDEPAVKPTTVNLSRNVNFNNDLEKAKKYLENFRSNSIVKDDHNLDVTKLLAIGESSTVVSTISPVKKRKAARAAESDSDWEDVIDSTENASNMIITVGPTLAPKVDKTQENIEASIKRKLNRQKKEAQVIMHKVNVLCWIGHGNYLNKILNDSRLMKMCLSFMPSQDCYPKDRLDKDYFEQISKWYKNKMTLKSVKKSETLTKLPPLAVSLALQIQNKSAICKKNYVLIFIILLRAIGIQCRLVVNLVPVPIRPAQSELCSLSSKSVDKSNGNSTSITKKVDVSTKKKIATKTQDRKRATNMTTESSQKLSSLNSKNSSSATNQRQSTGSTSQNESKCSTTTLPSTSKSLRAKLNATTAKIESAEQIRKSKAAQPVVPFNKSKSKQLEMVPEISTKESVKVISSPISRRTRGKVSDVKKTVKKPPLQQLDGGDDRRAKRKAPNLSKLKIAKKSPSTGDKRSRSSGSDSDSDFVPSPKKLTKPAQPKVVQNVKKAAKLDRRVLSTDDDNDETVAEQSKRDSMNFWVEVFTEVEDKWITIDLFKLEVDCVDSIRKVVTKPICYVLAWNNNNTIKDVSSRYCSNWNTVTRKLRVDPEWLNDSLHAYLEQPTLRSRMEDMELNKIHLKEPLPTVISEFKDHPLYALERHLLKFQAIYPPDALTLGFIRKEAVYARECVHTLHSREIWVKQARTVMLAQTPYKIVKARPKWDRHTNKMLEPLPLEIFGIWQTKPYEPPTAENGIVPRNAYGNVELFKPEMLPKKTVHLQLPSLNRTCKKMGIDCANAVIGFDYHSGSCHPTFDGFIVCEEFAEQVVEQWWLDQKEAQRKEEDKINQRVYGNWKKLVRGLMIRQHLQRKYNFAETCPDGNKKKKDTGEEVKKTSDSKKKATNEASGTGDGCSDNKKRKRM